MNVTANDLQRRLLYILHVGLVEIRNLALGMENQEIAELADALEILPGLIDRGADLELELIRFVLKEYQDKYQTNYDLPRRFEEMEPRAHF
jgi:hypothetical protein